MQTHQGSESIAAGTEARAGTYRCVCCGYVLRHSKDGRLPSCPADEGLHPVKAWYADESTTKDTSAPAPPTNKPR